MGCPTHHATNAHKHKFIIISLDRMLEQDKSVNFRLQNLFLIKVSSITNNCVFFREKSSKRRLLDTVQEFSLVCRGLVGTEYARQSIAAKQLVA